MRPLHLDNWPIVALGYLVCFVALDWISYIEPLGRFGITPWNPPAGLSFALLLAGGLRFFPLLLIAPLVADGVVRGVPTPVPLAVLLSLVTGAIYTAAVRLLLDRATRFDPRLGSSRDILILLCVGGASSLLVGVCYSGLLTATGYLDLGSWLSGTFRYWVGDFIGIVVTTPALLFLLEGKMRCPDLDGAVRLASILVALIIVFGLPQSAPLQLFYIMFLPVIWTALSKGIEETSLALVITQVGLIVTLQLNAAHDGGVLAYQLLMLVLATTGLVTGAVVTERRRAEQRVRLLQDAQARFNRMGSLGALAASLTHELNQPLSAAGTYARLALEALPEGDDGLAAARRHNEQSLAQIQRAAGIMRRVHDLIMIGRSELEATRVEAIIRDALKLLQHEIEESGQILDLSIERGLPQVLADSQQVGQVIINLVHNAIEEMQSAGTRGGRVTVSARIVEPGSVEIAVGDTGQGFTSEQIEAPVTVLASTKPSGLGIGLALCEMIIENHGGKLQLENTAEGGRVRFALREAKDGE